MKRLIVFLCVSTMATLIASDSEQEIDYPSTPNSLPRGTSGASESSSSEEETCEHCDCYDCQFQDTKRARENTLAEMHEVARSDTPPLSEELKHEQQREKLDEKLQMLRERITQGFVQSRALLDKLQQKQE